MGGTEDITYAIEDNIYQQYNHIFFQVHMIYLAKSNGNARNKSMRPEKNVFDGHPVVDSASKGKH